MKIAVAIVAAAMGLVSSSHAETPGAVYVATYVEFQPEAVAQGIELLNAYVAESATEPGNLGATAYREIGRPERFLIMESWRDDQAFVAHQDAAHAESFRDRFESLRRAPLDPRITSGFSVDTWRNSRGSDSVYVVTHVDVPGPFREQAEGMLRTLAEAGRRDKGLLRYDIYQQQDRPNHFTVFAAWDSRRDFDANGHTAPWQGFRDELASMLGALYDERLYASMTR